MSRPAIVAMLLVALGCDAQEAHQDAAPSSADAGEIDQRHDSGASACDRPNSLAGLAVYDLQAEPRPGQAQQPIQSSLVQGSGMLTAFADGLPPDELVGTNAGGFGADSTQYLRIDQDSKPRWVIVVHALPLAVPLEEGASVSFRFRDDYLPFSPSTLWLELRIDGDLAYYYASAPAPNGGSLEQPPELIALQGDVLCESQGCWPFSLHALEVRFMGETRQLGTDDRVTIGDFDLWHGFTAVERGRHSCDVVDGYVHGSEFAVARHVQ